MLSVRARTQIKGINCLAPREWFKQLLNGHFLLNEWGGSGALCEIYCSRRSCPTHLKYWYLIGRRRARVCENWFWALRTIKLWTIERMCVLLYERRVNGLVIINTFIRLLEQKGSSSLSTLRNVFAEPMVQWFFFALRVCVLCRQWVNVSVRQTKRVLRWKSIYCTILDEKPGYH